MTSALEAAKAGTNVILVEKEVELGGFQKRVKQIAAAPFFEQQKKSGKIDNWIQLANR